MHAVKVVHSKSSDKHEPSLTLRVALNKSWHRLIRDTLVVRIDAPSSGNFGFMNILISYYCPGCSWLPMDNFVACRAQNGVLHIVGAQTSAVLRQCVNSHQFRSFRSVLFRDLLLHIHCLVGEPGNQARQSNLSAYATVYLPRPRN